MSADVASTSPPQNLAKVDSAIEEGDAHHDEQFKPRRRTSSTVSNAFSISDIESQKVELAVAPETQMLNWKFNTSPSTIEEQSYLREPLTTPMVKKIDLCFDLGLTVTARNLKGVTIKDAVDAIYKQYRKRTDDELADGLYLKGFEWDSSESFTSLKIHTKMAPDAVQSSGKKASKKARSTSIAEDRAE